MTLDEIKAINAETRRTIAAAAGNLALLAEASLPYYGYVEVDFPDCPRVLMFTNNDAPGVSNAMRGAFEPQSMKVWARLCRGATGILDIGANVGIYSLCAARLRPDLKVHAFEPNPYAYARLRIHKVINGLDNMVEHQAAIGPEDGMAGFGWVVKPGGNISSGGGFGHYHKGTRKERLLVQVINLDRSGIAQTLGARPLVKIDVEGSERIVIDAMKETIALRPDMILETFNQETCDAFNAQFLPLGYRVYRVREKAGALDAADGLVAADLNDPLADFNHLLTTRPASEIGTLMGA
jgi:FkbM family methyltransferase